MHRIWQKAPSCQLVICSPFPGPDSPVKLTLFLHHLFVVCLCAFTPVVNLQTLQWPARFGTTVIWQRERCYLCVQAALRNVTQLTPLLSDIICHSARKSISSSWGADRLHVLARACTWWLLHWALPWLGTLKIEDWQLLCMWFLS